MGEGDPRNFLQPCLLLLLGERADHGYDLAARLRELHVAEGDPGTVYRALRYLERQGLIESSWDVSDSGPARRTYRLTAAGCDDLDRHAALLELTHQTLHEFRARFQRLKEGSGALTSGVLHNGVGQQNGGAGNGRGGHGRGDARGVRTAPPPREHPGG
ncbi:MAG TPA: helix-turn-helix transcriptional regulator [Pseudonocardia sp.]|nr:helix-turn-helix transcriptional regulator [Pseudonocardia sp.]